MPVLLLGTFLFIGTHSFTMARDARDALIGAPRRERLQDRLLPAFPPRPDPDRHRLRPVPRKRLRPGLDPPVWTRHLALILVWFAFLAFVAAYLPGRIKGALKHPMMVGIKVWALAHLLANGDLGSMLLFGSLLAWAVLARISVKRRSVAAAHGGPLAEPAGFRNDALALAIGTAAFLVFAIWLHPRWIGVAVWPGQA